MWRNYFKIAIRGLWRRKGIAAINIIGLALGITCCLLIGMYVTDELSYDRFHEKKDRLYRVAADIDMNGVISTGMVGFGVLPQAKEEFPEVVNFLRIDPHQQNPVITFGNQFFKEKKVMAVDSSFFTVFTFPLGQGNPKTALALPNSMVITPAIAEKYFGENDPLGKMVKVDGEPFQVTGVLESAPYHSDLDFDILLSLQTYRSTLSEHEQDWFRLSGYGYLLFNGQVDEHKMEAELNAFADRHVTAQLEGHNLAARLQLDLQPITSVHLDNSKSFDTPKGNKQNIYIFSVVALFILIIASINYINLSLSQSGKRIKEVGVRKTLGAVKGNLIRQFLGESFLVTFISIILALLMIELFLPAFNQLADKSFVFGDLFQPQLLLLMGAILVLVGFISGSYPSFVISSFSPSEVLRGDLPQLGRIGVLRKILVALQFSFSIFIILCTVVISRQMSYLNEQDLGFEGEQVMTIEVPKDSAVSGRMDMIKDELNANPKIRQVAVSGGIPGRGIGELMFRMESDAVLTERTSPYIMVDEDFIGTMGLELIEGRNFSKEIQSDIPEGFIINETAARNFGWEDDAVGKRIQWSLLPNNQAGFDGKVIGVIKDFHFKSLHNPLEPLVLIYRPEQVNFLSISMAAGNINRTIDFTQEVWEKLIPGQPMEYSFLNVSFAQLYQKEAKTLILFTWFAIFSILIACLGLFALTSFTVEQRTREIGIRKILGASVPDIVLLISRDFMLMVSIAFIIASPVAWYFLNQWLQDFAYRTAIHSSLFVLAGMAVALIALCTVSIYSIRAARANPALALRYE